ncbi:Na+/H+ antiporter NhaC [bacterium LRH843]|nr:Na+/H+ antiporter NhaC [bacterium LRH843]
MFRIKTIQMPSLKEALFLTGIIVFMISFCIIALEAVPHLPILFSILLLILYGISKGISLRHLEEGMAEGAKSGMGAVLLFFLIGMLISSWMIGGTIPTLVHVGFDLVTPKFFFAIVFITTSIIGVCVGSSLTTAATAGVAFIGIASAIDVSLALTAGAIVSGAFFGDKMSPLSDTTNLASAMIQVDLFEHIRNMAWTTVPAFLIALVLFGMLSPTVETTDFMKMKEFQANLLATGLVHWYSLIPLAILLVMTFRKIPATLTLAAGALSAILISFFHVSQSFSSLFQILFSGYVSTTGSEEIDALLSRGGLESMMFTVGLVLLALAMGGLLFTLGIIPRLLQSIEQMLKKVSSVILASALSAIGINVVIGEQYLSILLTGEAFQSQYEKVGLANKNLSRVLEDAGTVINPLVPWSVCGVFITNVLGVSTLEYLPFAFFCLLSPILTIIAGYTGKTLTYLKH